MAYCKKCGRKLADDAAFCTGCGALAAQGKQKRVWTSQSREETWEGITHKCPECGQPVPSFIDSCPNCGHEFRGVGAVISARELSNRLDAIEASRLAETKKKGRDGQQEIGPTDARKISLIRSFPIPNAKEDLIEFLILALSNCDLRLDEFGEERGTEAEKAITSAWETKLNQALSKAEILFGDEPEFERLKGMWGRKKSEIERKKKRGRKNFAVLMLGFLGVMLLSYLLAMSISLFQK